jgi:signal peptidase I
LESYRSEIIPEEPPPANKRSPALTFALEVVQTVLMALVLYFLIDLVLGRVRVENISMLPTLKPGQFILVNKLAYRLGDYQRGDVVIFHHSATEDYIKRVIGLPGDKVHVQGGIVFINDQPLTEAYTAAPPNYTGAWTVPENELFVLGDNRNQSSDSHSWGFVPGSTVVGRALIVYWPLDDFKILNKGPTVQAAN